MKWLDDLLLFFFPSNCRICGKRLTGLHDVLCLTCESKLPRTRYLDRPDNPVSMIFWGRVPVEVGTSMIRFEKGSAYQGLFHDLKYGGDRKIGVYLGKLLGMELSETIFAGCDLLVPVPLHSQRMRKRGYNQSALIAWGVSRVLRIPVDTRLLKRPVRQESQTSFARYERYQNVSGSFRIGADPAPYMGKKICLIDDVITTGATLEACCKALIMHLNCRLFVATVSCA